MIASISWYDKTLYDSVSVHIPGYLMVWGHIFDLPGNSLLMVKLTSPKDN